MKRLSMLLTVLMLLGGQATAQNFSEIDRQREAGQFQQALSSLEKLRQANPNNGEVLWRLSRTRVDIGEQMGAGSGQTTAYSTALNEAVAAVKADPRNAETHLAHAIAAGRVGLNSSTKRKIELSREVKQSIDRALEINPQLGIAYHVRARWNYEVSSLNFMERAVVKVVYGGLPNASFEAAAADFRKAIQFEDKVINRLELGRTYLKLGNKAGARTELNRAISMPNSDPDDPAHKAEARKLLAKTN